MLVRPADPAEASVAPPDLTASGFTARMGYRWDTQLWHRTNLSQCARQAASWRSLRGRPRAATLAARASSTSRGTSSGANGSPNGKGRTRTRHWARPGERLEAGMGPGVAAPPASGGASGLARGLEHGQRGVRADQSPRWAGLAQGLV